MLIDKGLGKQKALMGKGWCADKGRAGKTEVLAEPRVHDSMRRMMPQRINISRRGHTPLALCWVAAVAHLWMALRSLSRLNDLLAMGSEINNMGCWCQYVGCNQPCPLSVGNEHMHILCFMWYDL